MQIFARCDSCGFLEFFPSGEPLVCHECGHRHASAVDLPAVGGFVVRLQRENHRLTTELLVERGELPPEALNDGH